MFSHTIKSHLTDWRVQQQVEDSAADLVDAVGLGDDFAKVQRTIARLR